MQASAQTALSGFGFQAVAIPPFVSRAAMYWRAWPPMA